MFLVELYKIIEDGENSTVEFKRKFSSPEKIAKEMIAFANTKGGRILFGVDDDKTIIGVESEKGELESIKTAAKFYCEPEIEFETGLLLRRRGCGLREKAGGARQKYARGDRRQQSRTREYGFHESPSVSGFSHLRRSQGVTLGYVMRPLIATLLLAFSAVAADRPWQQITVPATSDAAANFSSPPAEYGMVLWWFWNGQMAESDIVRDLDETSGEAPLCPVLGHRCPDKDPRCLTSFKAFAAWPPSRRCPRGPFHATAPCPRARCCRS